MFDRLIGGLDINEGVIRKEEVDRVISFYLRVLVIVERVAGFFVSLIGFKRLDLQVCLYREVWIEAPPNVGVLN